MFKKLMVLLGMIGVLLSCNEQKPKEYIPKYDKFTNDLERENLIGKVKRVVHSKKKYRFYEFEDKTNDLIISDIDYNIYGNMVKALYFDENGVLIKRREYKYSANQRVTRWFVFYVDSSMRQKSINNVYQKYDSLGNRLYAQGYYLGKLCKAENLYDSMNNVIKEIRDDLSDIHVRQYKNFYNPVGQLYKRIKYDTNWDGYTLEKTEQYQYDKRGRLIEKTIEGNIGEKEKIIQEYDQQGRKVKYTKFDRCEIDTIIEYDIYSNPTKVEYGKGYSPSQKMLEEKYEYVYDYYGNWVVKKIYTNEGMNNGGYWLKDIENRKIEYYK